VRCYKIILPWQGRRRGVAPRRYVLSSCSVAANVGRAQPYEADAGEHERDRALSFEHEIHELSTGQRALGLERQQVDE
jgi:hypothetical protein